MPPIRSLLPRRWLTPASYPIQLLSRPGCHLCEDALEALIPFFGRTNIEEIDITSDEDLESLYVFRIPVVLHQDQVICEGIVDRKAARAARQSVRRMNAGKLEAL